ncbi:MAG: T9SS C-terminal target domain-containing protein [Candidatus Zixiibacteriota bacterium]|nr:MAG: T9SS C-terminal target domain-containing protein [candidate division Zixibacteria bacterium]
MLRFRNVILGISLVLAFGLTTASQAEQVTVFIENLSPSRGVWLTPLWVGFHDGTFDTHDLEFPATEAVERLAEDGDTGPISTLFEAAPGTREQATIVSETGIPPFSPGETASYTFDLDPTSCPSIYLSFLSMVVPSNDAFIGNENAQAHLVYQNGEFHPLHIIVTGEFVKDAGTEDNDEVPENTAFLGQTVPNTGVGTEGVVDYHNGFLSPSEGNILSDPDFVNADFTGSFYQVARIVVYRGEQPLTAEVCPGATDPFEFPYEGGSFTFFAHITNISDRTWNFQAWTMVTAPNGFQIGPVIGPADIVLAAGETLDIDRTQFVPEIVPAGEYLYRGYVGAFPGTPVDQDYLTVVKHGSRDGAPATYFGPWPVGDPGVKDLPAAVTASSQPARAEVSPNPFNPAATIRYTLPEASRVSLAVFDVSGRQVAQLVDGAREAGSHEVTFDGSNLASGVYLYRLQTGGQVFSGKMMLLK